VYKIILWLRLGIKLSCNFVAQVLLEKGTIMNELSAIDSIAGHAGFSFPDLQVIDQSSHSTSSLLQLLFISAIAI